MSPPPAKRTPLRGEVWDVAFPRVGNHPAVLLTINQLLPRLSEVTVALVTGTNGPRATRIPLGAAVGLTGHRESYADTTQLHTVPRARLHKRRGLTSPGELAAIEDGIRLALGL